MIIRKNQIFQFELHLDYIKPPSQLPCKNTPNGCVRNANQNVRNTAFTMLSVVSNARSTSANRDIANYSRSTEAVVPDLHSCSKISATIHNRL